MIRRVPRSIVAISLLVFVLAAGCAALSPLFDPDEGYYPATAAETLRTGSFWDLHFNGAPRWDKPILSYALIEGAFTLFGENVTAARIPSAIEGAALIGLIGMLVGRLAGSRAGVLSALVVGSTTGVSIFSRAAHPEIAVVLSIMATELLACVRLTAADAPVQRTAAIAAGVSVAYGILAKGPVAVILPLIALLIAVGIIGLPRARLWSVRTAVIALVLTLPWYVAMTARYGTRFLREGVWQQNVDRYATAAYRHPAAVLLLPLAALVGLLPWVGFLPQAVARLQWRNPHPREVVRTTMFVSAVSALAFYSLSHSKLPSYSLVCVPPLGIVIALWLDDVWMQPEAMRRAWYQLAAVISGIAVVLLSASLWVGRLVTTRQLLGALRPQDSDVTGLLAPISMPLGLLLAFGVVVLVVVTGTRTRVAIVTSIGLLAPVLVLMTGRPLLQAIYPWDALGRHVQPGHGKVWLLARRAPSLTFYARQPVSTATDGAMLEAEIVGAHEGWLAVTREDCARLSAKESIKKTSAEVVSENGRMVLVHFTSRSGPGSPR